MKIEIDDGYIEWVAVNQIPNRAFLDHTVDDKISEYINEALKKDKQRVEKEWGIINE